ncbi:hypothetical protein MRB53_039031 [Persea americana]|nr:hypothetical protein MRB53_039031 [Persea americana]
MPNWIMMLVHDFAPKGTMLWDFAQGKVNVCEKRAQNSQSHPGGATIHHPITPAWGTDLNSELSWFNYVAMAEPTRERWNGENSVFIFHFGTNDFAVSHLWPNWLEETGPAIMETYSLRLEDIAPLWRTAIWLIDVAFAEGPWFPPDERETVATLTKWWNEQLYEVAAKLRKMSDDTLVTVFDLVSVFRPLIDHPEDYGFRDSMCEDVDGLSCLWHDGAHPGFKLHEAWAKRMHEHLLETDFYHERRIDPPKPSPTVVAGAIPPPHRIEQPNAPDAARPLSSAHSSSPSANHEVSDHHSGGDLPTLEDFKELADSHHSEEANTLEAHEPIIPYGSYHEAFDGLKERAAPYHTWLGFVFGACVGMAIMIAKSVASRRIAAHNARQAWVDQGGLDGEEYHMRANTNAGYKRGLSYHDADIDALAEALPDPDRYKIVEAYAQRRGDGREEGRQ